MVREAPWACLLAFAAALACQERENRQPAPVGSARGDAVLAELDGHALTVREFEARLASLPPEVRAQYASPAAREHLLGDMVRLELLAGEARRRGVDRSPSVKVRLDEILVEEMMNGLFGSETAQAAAVTAEEMRAYYEAHQREFRSPEERRATALIFSEREAAESVRRRLPAREADTAVVQKVSHAAGATLADLGFFSVTSTTRPPDALRDAIFRIQAAGDVADTVVEDAGKFHVLVLTGVRPAIVRELRDVETLVRARVAQDKRREAVARFVDDVRARSKVRVHAERLPRAAAVPGAASAQP